MSAEGVKKFIAAIDLVFPAPQFDGDKTRQAAWVALMTRTLGGSDDGVLSEAASMILRTRNPKKDGRFFPTPQECITACHEVAEEMERRRAPLLLENKTAALPYHARVRLARDMMQSPMGRAAVKAGWGSAMFHFCVENQRMPTGREAEECQREAREFDRVYAQCLTGDHPLGGPLARLAENMVRKARELMGEKAA
jgi:hypothetical protein